MLRRFRHFRGRLVTPAQEQTMAGLLALTLDHDGVLQAWEKQHAGVSAFVPNEHASGALMLDLSCWEAALNSGLKMEDACGAGLFSAHANNFYSWNDLGAPGTAPASSAGHLDTQVVPQMPYSCSLPSDTESAAAGSVSAHDARSRGLAMQQVPLELSTVSASLSAANADAMMVPDLALGPVSFGSTATSGGSCSFAVVPPSCLQGLQLQAPCPPPAPLQRALSTAPFADTVQGSFMRTRTDCLERYREKKACRLYTKKIRYQLRKINADRRPRIKGRFVKKEDLAQYWADQAAAGGAGPEAECDTEAFEDGLLMPEEDDAE